MSGETWGNCLAKTCYGYLAPPSVTQLRWMDGLFNVKGTQQVTHTHIDVYVCVCVYMELISSAIFCVYSVLIIKTWEKTPSQHLLKGRYHLAFLQPLDSPGFKWKVKTAAADIKICHLSRELIFDWYLSVWEFCLSIWVASAGDEEFWGSIVFNLARTFVSCTACNCYHTDKNTEM